VRERSSAHTKTCLQSALESARFPPFHLSLSAYAKSDDLACVLCYGIVRQIEATPMIKAAKRVALYLRVSSDDSTVENQRRELEAAAARHGWEIVATFTDEGISGAKGRDTRPGFDKLLKGVARREFDLVAAWAVDRLGRSLQDLIGFLTDLQAKRVDLYLHQQGLDTSTPSGRAMFQMLGVFAEFERAMITARINAGLARAKAQGKVLGRPSAMTPEKNRKARAMLGKGVGILKVAKTLGLGSGTVQKIKAEMQNAA
jgi:DNA invertase Pin-like site-specific DNA recombinase